jgi:colicin import membrane protein
VASKKYPLDALAKLREEEVSRATRSLAERVHLREEAERQRRTAEDDIRRAEEKARAVRAVEQAKLERGELSVADLARAEAWAIAVDAEKERLEARVVQAKAHLSEARGAESRAQAELSARTSEADVVEKDRAKWQDAIDRAAEARQEEEAADGWRPKRG